MADVGFRAPDQHIPHSDVCDIILVHRGQEFFALNVVPPGFIKEQAFRQTAQIAIHGFGVDLSVVGCHGVGNGRSRSAVADIVHDKFGDGLQHIDISNIVSLDYIIQQNAFIDRTHIVAGIHQAVLVAQNIGERADTQVKLKFFLDGERLAVIFQPFAKLLEGERHHREFHIPSRQTCCQFVRHEIRIGAGQVEVAVFIEEQAVHRLLILINVLNFIEEDIVFLVGDEPPADVPVQGPVVEQVFVVDAFKVDVDDVPVRHAVRAQEVLEDGKKGGLAAASDARHHLDDVLVLMPDEPVQILRALDKIHRCLLPGGRIGEFVNFFKKKGLYSVFFNFL